jgi:TRAP-type C4-dicarboxylate transport system permease small subunit
MNLTGYQALRRAFDAVDNVMMFFGATMLFALMFVIVSDVALRYLFNSPIFWAYEVVSSYLMPGLFFFAVSHTLKAHAHVSVDIVHSHIGRRMRYVFETIATLVSMPVFAICTWISARNTMLDFTTGAESTSGLAVPTWTISIMLPIGFGLITLRLILNAIGYLGTLASGRELQPLPPIAGSEEVAP